MKQNLFLDIGINKIDNNFKIEETKNNCFKTTHFIITKENKKALKKEVGDYFTIEFKYENLFTKTNRLTKEVERIIKSFLKKYHKNEKVLIIGLGNKDVPADSLGYDTTNKLIATNQYADFLTIPKIALFNPSVTEKTGIDSFLLIKMVVENLQPDCIIVIDSLITKDENKINQVIEISDTGIIPGSAINTAKEINRNTFHIPILTIGVPTCFEKKKKYYTTIEIKEIISLTSSIIASAMNNIFIKNN